MTERQVDLKAAEARFEAAKGELVDVIKVLVQDVARSAQENGTFDYFRRYWSTEVQKLASGEDVFDIGSGVPERKPFYARPENAGLTASGKLYRVVPWSYMHGAGKYSQCDPEPFSVDDWFQAGRHVLRAFAEIQQTIVKQEAYHKKKAGAA